jgi:acetoacetyl-CoA synthetase
MSMSEESPILWQPGERERERSRMAHYLKALQRDGHGPFPNYASLHGWSVHELESFWRSVWDFADLQADTPVPRMLERPQLPGARWLPGVKLNFARNLLRYAEGERAQQEAVVAYAESRPPVRKRFAELLADVGAFEAFLRSQSVQVGDRVAAVSANSYEALVAMLAVTSLGAVWSSASPDFGIEAAVDRFGQIEPKLLIAVNGYGYGGKHFARAEEVQALAKRLPSVTHTVAIEHLPGAPMPTGRAFSRWEDALREGQGASPSFTSLPADHPVYILYSSGTTGKPKCIVHGAGGLLLNHAKELMLHGDVGAGDRFLYFTTCGWMMWNWQASALAMGATLIVYDGSPGHPDPGLLWRIAADEQLTHLGLSARFIAGCRKAELAPKQELDLTALRVVFSTGSPLLPEDYDWFYANVSDRVLLGSIAGGTDICGCFVGSNPLLPVRRGEIQCAMLGADVAAFDAEGEPLTHGRGELVCRSPLPSMPVGFWNDPDGSRYRAAYFDTFPGVWAHGDFVAFTPSGGAIIYGRSDATLNPGGVRIGTAEIYRQVETITEIKDSLVVARPLEGDVEIVLLVVLQEGVLLDEPLRQAIKRQVRSNASPRHVPAHIVAVEDIPYTRSGKKVEIAVTRMLQGEREAGNRSALSNPEALDGIAASLRQAGLLAQGSPD